MGNSLKFIFRTPMRTIAFCIIFICSAALFSAGINLWLHITDNIKAAQNAYATIGMIRQIPEGTILDSRWDAGVNDYIYQAKESYGHILNEDILKNLDVDYISSPQRRPYFGAYNNEYLTGAENTEMADFSSIIEFTPTEDCIPNGPVKVEVLNVLWGDESLAGKEIDFCDHRTREPAILSAKQKYIAYITMNPMNVDLHEGFGGIFEYMPVRVFEEQTELWYEVTEDFFNTENGKLWSGIIEAHQKRFKGVPVTPVTDIKLIDAFRNGDAVIVEGEAIENEKYSDFPYVCMVPQNFAKLNNLKIDDSIVLQYMFADFKTPVAQAAYLGGGLGVAAINSTGKELPVFQESQYRIMGIYSYPVSLTEDPSALGENQIFVPQESITEDYSDHIIEDGPMQMYNTSFRIENGSVLAFMEQFSKLEESQFLEVRFDDGGYEQFAAKMKQVQIVAAVLWVTGLFLLLAVIAFLMFYQIILQRRHTAIERALGMTKKQCVTSLLSGIMLLTVVCVTSGTIIGVKTERYVNLIADYKNEYFDTSYTKGAIDIHVNEGLGTGDDEGDDMVVILIICMEIIVVWLLAIFFINRNLKIPPISLLSFREIT